MRLPESERVLAALAPPVLAAGAGQWCEGRLLALGPTLLRAHLPQAALGQQCALPGGGRAEVVGLDGPVAMLSPFSVPQGLAVGMLVRPTEALADVGVGPALLGRVLDALGQPLDGLAPPRTVERRPLDAAPPAPMTRPPIASALPTGVRAVDAALTVGQGQRVAVLAPAGCGKSTLLGMLCADSDADVVVLALVGERGREVRDFLENTLSPEVRARCVVVVATSDRPALERIKAAACATAIAESFRDRGQKVLLLVDSLTRYARAVREVALAAGEPIVAGGYPPSLFALLPRLLERAGPAAVGSITAFYTVLMEDRHDPLAEEVRSLLDGHFVLSRKLAEAGHFPAIDVLASVSRVMSQVASPAHCAAASRLRRLMTLWQEIELLVRVGEYRVGQDAEADEAQRRRPQIDALLRQARQEHSDFAASVAALGEVVDLPC